MVPKSGEVLGWAPTEAAPAPSTRFQAASRLVRAGFLKELWSWEGEREVGLGVLPASARSALLSSHPSMDQSCPHAPSGVRMGMKNEAVQWAGQGSTSLRQQWGTGPRGTGLVAMG